MTPAPRTRLGTSAAGLGAALLVVSPFLHWIRGSVTETQYVLRGYGATVYSGTVDRALGTGFEKAGLVIVVLLGLTALAAVAVAVRPRRELARAALALGGLSTTVLAFRLGLFQPDDGLGDAAVHLEPGAFVAVLGTVLSALGGVLALAGPRPDASRGWAAVALTGAAATALSVVLVWSEYVGSNTWSGPETADGGGPGTGVVLTAQGHDTVGIVLVGLLLLAAATAAVLGIAAALAEARDLRRVSVATFGLAVGVAGAAAVRLAVFPPDLGSGDADGVELRYGVVVAFAGLALCAVAALGCRSAAGREPRVPSASA